MVSPISIPGFPFVHTRQSAATCDAALESRLASLEACVTALPSLITAAIDQAFADSLTQFRRDMFFRGVGEGISAPLAGDHHGSPAIDLIHLPRSPICAEGVSSQLIPSAVQAPPLLSSSLLLRALATSAVKPHSKDSAAATISLTESKTVIHASTMTIASWLILTHLFPNTTKTGSEVLLLFGVIACYTGHSAIVYHVCLNAKYGWVNWYLVGKFVKKNFYALHLFDEMSKRHNMENMSLSSNLEAWDIVVLVCRSWPKDLAASFTEEYVPQLARLRWGDGPIMVSQFMDELQAHGGPTFDNLGRDLFWERQLHMMQLGDDYAERMLSKFFDLTTRGNFAFQISTLWQMLKSFWNAPTITDYIMEIEFLWEKDIKVALWGGNATSLIFSAFESWLVVEHNKRGFDQQWLSLTFSKATLEAVMAKAVSQWYFPYHKTQFSILKAQVKSSYFSPSYMAHHQPDINKKMRAILINWLITVHYKFELMGERQFLTANLIDRFLERQMVIRKQLQLVGVTAMLLACKYEVSIPIVADFVMKEFDSIFEQLKICMVTLYTHLPTSCKSLREVNDRVKALGHLMSATILYPWKTNYRVGQVHTKQVSNGF